MNAFANVMGHAGIHTTRRYAHSTDVLRRPGEGRLRAVAAIGIAGKRQKDIVGGKR